MFSTTHCTYVVNETISHYNFSPPNVHVLMFDASKAFDRIKYCKLFEQLLAYNMSPLVLWLLSLLYTNQTMQVRWKSSIGNSFSVSNGVKQGGILSPVLFAVYMDGLLNKLKNSGIGCYMGNNFKCGVPFADEIKLLTPTHKGLNKHIYICEQYAAEFDIKFNGAKTNILYIKVEIMLYITKMFLEMEGKLNVL